MNNPQKNQKGAVVIIVAVMLIPFIAFLGLAVDSGYMFVKKNELQNVADAVALACLIKDRDSACGTALNPTAATPVTSRTDITPILTPVIPPGNPTDYIVHATYPYTPCPSSATQCAQASASTNFTPFFMHIFGFSNLAISASAVAANAAGVDCLSVTNLLFMNGTPDIKGIKCNIRMGSVKDNGTPFQIAANNYLYNSNPSADCGSHCIPPAISLAGPVPTPSFSPSAPTWSTASPQVNPNGCFKKTCNLSPGYYPTGIDCSRAQSDCRFAPGKYYLDSSLNLASANGTASGTQVFFYMGGNKPPANGLPGSGDISITAGAIASLTGFDTSTGTCAATNYQLLFYAPNTISGTFTLQGGTISAIVGNIYLPNYDMTWGGGNDMAVDGTLIVKSFTANGNNTFTIDPTKISCHFAGGGKISLIE